MTLRVNPAVKRSGLRRLSKALIGALPAAAVCLALAAPAAQAIPPPAPALTGTVPPSPSTSLTPLIQGVADGIITRRVPRSGVAGRIITRGSSTVTISIYTNPNCTGTPVAAGTGVELEGAGIGVTVAPDSITTFYADATDSSLSTSPCSNPGLIYQQVTSGPGPPTPASVSPGSPANDNSPRVSGASAVGTTVKLYSDATCTGTLLGSGSAAEFAGSGIQASVADDTTTTVYASASLAGVNSICSAAFVTYREDSTAPKTPELKVLPASRANDNNPRLTGSAPGASMVKIYDNSKCNGQPLVTGTPAELDAGFQLSVAENSTSSFFARATDNAGNSSACSAAPVLFVEDSLPPRTRITLGPGTKTRKRGATFRFTDATANPGTKFLCKLDRGKWRSCRTPRKFGHLRFGKHTVRVKAVDAAGNKERLGAKRRFKVIGRPRHR